VIWANSVKSTRKESRENRDVSTRPDDVEYTDKEMWNLSEGRNGGNHRLQAKSLKKKRDRDHFYCGERFSARPAWLREQTEGKGAKNGSRAATQKQGTKRRSFS